jgi:hypothetical protein
MLFLRNKMSKEQEVVQTSHEDEGSTGSTTVVEKLQAVLARGAIFNFGLPYDPPTRGKLASLNREPVQPTLQGGTVGCGHQGGCRIGLPR